tara:strand:+ start:380 stop:562 length:183 start_codon:yes stop_codon:yes gene_type:complete
MITNILNLLNSSYNAINTNNIENIDPNLVRYFKTEFGKDWHSALDSYLREKKVNNDKKAA